MSVEFGISDEQRWIRLALQEAWKAYECGEIPVGAVVVNEGKVIGRGYNQVETLQDPTAHAEIIAIGAAATALESWRLSECDLYVTLEPCPMCAGAIHLARIRRLVFGAYDPKKGACGSLMDIVRDERLNHRVEVVPGVSEEDCSYILKAFFEDIRFRRGA